jgi:hypothetical protein
MLGREGSSTGTPEALPGLGPNRSMQRSWRRPIEVAHMLKSTVGSLQPLQAVEGVGERQRAEIARELQHFLQADIYRS